MGIGRRLIGAPTMDFAAGLADRRMGVAPSMVASLGMRSH
jgi:hypothetical protein